MPTNVTPEYERAQERFRQAATDDERLDALQEMLSTIPKHKGTEKVQADIKRRISQLRKSETRKGKRKGADPFHVPRSGAGQVILIGPPNVGKSSLVAATTNAPVKVAEYPYTTTFPTPGMCMFEDVQIELIDTPPVVEEHVPAGLMGTIRAADVVCVVADGSAEPLEQADMVLCLLADKGLWLQSLPRNELGTADPSRLSGLLAVNKMDLSPAGTAGVLRKLYGESLVVCPVSATTGERLDVLVERFWHLLAMVRVYTKQPGKPPDRKDPYALDIGSTVEDLARAIHRELPEKMKFARIWGDGRIAGQQVHRSEPLRDKDVVEIRE